METTVKKRKMVEGSGQVENSFCENPFGLVKCVCGEHWVTKVGKKCIECKRIDSIIDQADSEYQKYSKPF